VQPSARNHFGGEAALIIPRESRLGDGVPTLLHIAPQAVGCRLGEHDGIRGDDQCVLREVTALELTPMNEIHRNIVFSKDPVIADQRVPVRLGVVLPPLRTACVPFDGMFTDGR